MATPGAGQRRRQAGAIKKRPARALSRTQVSAAVKTMAAASGTARFGAGKALTVTAEKDPDRVYAHFDEIVALLGSDSKIVRWNAMQILARLAPVDAERKLDGVLDKYVEFIAGNDLVSAANAIQGIGRIALSRPDLHDRALPALLSVERATYRTPECRNVAIQQVLDVLRELGPGVCRQPAVAKFVHRQQTNPRAGVARRAQRMVAELA